MKIEQQHQAEVKAEILRRIQQECREWNYRMVLLINFVETYLVLEGDQLDAYQRLLQHEPKYKEIPQMILTYADRLEAKGETKGKRETLQMVLIETASRQCGTPDDDTKARGKQIEDVARLERLFKAAFSTASWSNSLPSCESCGG